MNLYLPISILGEPVSDQWEFLGAAMREAREAARLRLEDIGGYSVSHLSRAERGHTFIKRGVIERYVMATGNSGLLDRYEDALAKPREAPTDGPLAFDLAFVLEELYGTVQVSDDRVRVSEHRVIRPLNHDLSHLYVRRGLAQVEGRTPRMLRVDAVRSRIEQVGWISETYFGVDVSFPEPVPVNGLYRFGLEYELDFMYPSYMLTPLVHTRKFGITLQLPSQQGWMAYAFDGMPPSVAKDFRESALSGRKHSLRAVEIDRFGGLEVSFDDLSPGLTHGIIWVRRE